MSDQPWFNWKLIVKLRLIYWFLEIPRLKGSLILNKNHESLALGASNTFKARPGWSLVNVRITFEL
jgi:hypothetical protein